MLLRTFPLVLLLLFAGTGGRVRADDAEDALGGRYKTPIGAEEQRGGWRAWVETRSDERSRAMRQWTSLMRQGPDGKVQTLLMSGRGGLGGDFRLHEKGWVVAGTSEGMRLFSPDAAPAAPGSEVLAPAASTLHTDLHVTPPSRFLADGYLSLGLQGFPNPHPRLQILWVPLTAKGLVGGAHVVEIPGSSNVDIPEIQIRVDEEPGAWIVTWMAPAASVPVHGRARIDRKTHVVKRLPDPEGPPTVRVAAVQCPSVLGDVAANTKRLTALVQDAARQGAKIVVLPETAVTGYLSQDLKTTWHVPGRPRAPQFVEGRHPSAAAERVPGTSVWHFAGLARRFGLYITVPLLEADTSQKETRYFNTVCLVSPQGQMVAHYRKLNPWPHPEQSWAETGDKGLATFDTAYGRVGLAICFDVHTVLKQYVPRDLWTLLYPIAWVSESDADDATWFGRDLPLRVKESAFHLVGANWSTETPQSWFGAGHSLVVKRDGTVLASAKTKVGAEIVFADLPVRR